MLGQRRRATFIGIAHPPTWTLAAAATASASGHVLRHHMRCDIV